MNVNYTDYQALYSLFTEACRPLMQNKKFLTNKEYFEKRGQFSVLAGHLHKIEKTLKMINKKCKVD